MTSPFTSEEKLTTVSSSMAANTLSTTPSSNSSSPVLITNVSRLKPKKGPIPPPLQPLADYSRLIGFAPQKTVTVCFGGSGFGVFARNGLKKSMEDSHRVVPCLVGSSKKGFFGVYDGHAGVKAAEFVAENLHKNVLEMMNKCKEKEEKVEALKAAYLKTDRDFLEQHDDVSGACCVTALIQDQEMIVSNLGDCRAVLCRRGIAEALTTDHKIERADESERIESQGGYTYIYRGTWGISGTLAVSRSIGHPNYKKWVVAEPDTRILELEQDMEFLVLASDGLWNVVSNQEAIDTALRVLAQGKTPRESEEENLIQGLVNVSPSRNLWQVSPSKSLKITPLKSIDMTSEPSWAKTACKELVNLAVNRCSMDDITVVVVDLNHYKC